MGFGESLDDWNTTDKQNQPSDVADVLYSEASRLNKAKRYSEALVVINIAIEHEDNFLFHTEKGNILENLNRFRQSAEEYDRAFEINPSDEITECKARALYKWANSLNDKNQALELINEALLILPEGCQSEYLEKFLYLKGSILDCLGRPIESRKCYMMAEGMVDEIRRLDEEVEYLKNSKDTLINITGTRFYFGLEPFAKGITVNLIREPENEHDSDAIRAEIQGETVGYVANNDYTVIENVKSASEIINMDFKSAEVVMIYLDEYVIAKLKK